MTDASPRHPDTLAGFLARCDAFAARRRIRRSTLSTWLFRDGKRLGAIASGKSDIGVRRLDQAERDLAEIEAVQVLSMDAA